MRLQKLITDNSIESVLNKINVHFDNVRSTSQNRILRVFTPNSEMVVEMKTNKPFFAALNAAEIRVPDGIGLVIADWIQSQFPISNFQVPSSKAKGFPSGLLQFPNKKFNHEWKIRQRVAGIDLAESVVKLAQEKNLKVMAIGGMDNDTVEINYQNLSLPIGYMRGPKDVTNETEDEWKTIKGKLESFQPKILLVGFGAPKQELWINKHLGELEGLGIGVVMAVGGTLDVWVNKASRAPLKWQNFGLEWLWRLIHEPWRIIRQMSLVKFAMMALMVPITKSGEWFEDEDSEIASKRVSKLAR